MKIFNSIKFRLQLWYGLLLVLVLAGFWGTAFQLERGRIMRRVDDELYRRVNDLLPRRRAPNDRMFRRPDGGITAGRPLPESRVRGLPPLDPEDAPEGFGDPPPEGESWNLPSEYNQKDAAYYCVIWRPEGHQLPQGNRFRSVDAPPDIPVPVSGATLRGPQPPRMRGVFREVFVITPPNGFVLVGHDMTPEFKEMRQVALKLALVGGAILMFGLAGGWWLASRAIRPIADISEAARKISTADLSQRIQTGDHSSELGQLAATLNSTFARLEASFVQQAQFTSDAAHELRTPVSVILTQAQSALKRERTAAEYRETLEACERAATRMRRLTESLLQLARLDAGQETMRREPFDLAAVAQNCAVLITPLAEAKGIKVRTDVAAADCLGDSDRIGQVITNLLNNAINYNRSDGEILVSVRCENNFGLVSVSDTGVGISQEDLPRVFERFYRGDKSRTGSGNAGLGLAICRAIVEAHGGTIEVASQPGTGTTIIVRLPAA